MCYYVCHSVSILSFMVFTGKQAMKTELDSWMMEMESQFCHIGKKHVTALAESTII